MMFYVLLILLTSLYRAEGRCSFPCARQVAGTLVGVLGEVTGEVITFSCKHPAEIHTKSGEIIECFEGHGPFLVLRRKGNEFRCIKRMAVDPNGRLTLFYRTPWRTYKRQPTLCKACTVRPKMWTLNIFANQDVTQEEINALKLPPMGCNVPKNCPITKPFKQQPCLGCEPTEDDGYCCKGCKVHYKGHYYY